MADNEQRLIEAGNLWSDIMALPHNGDMVSSDEVEQAIIDAPTVDAVEVIRCQDCEKWNSDHYCERAAVVELPPLLEAILYQTAPDDFCSRAVRRVNNETEQQTAAEPAG